MTAKHEIRLIPVVFGGMWRDFALSSQCDTLAGGLLGWVTAMKTIKTQKGRKKYASKNISNHNQIIQ